MKSVVMRHLVSAACALACALSLPQARADTSQGQAVAQPAPANDPVRMAAVQGRYARKGKPGDFIELNADGTLGLRQDGLSVHGNYTVQGDRISFTSPEMPGLTTNGHIAGDTITDDEGIIWEKMTEEQRAAAPPVPERSADFESTSTSVVGKYVAKGVAYYLQLNPDGTVSCGHFDGSTPRENCGTYKVLGPGVSLKLANNRPTNLKLVGNTLVGKTQVWEREVVLTNKEVMKLIELDLGDEIVIAKIKNAPKESLDVSTDALLALKKAKVSSAVVAAMIERAGQAAKTSATVSPSAAAPAAPAVPRDPCAGVELMGLYKNEIFDRAMGGGVIEWLTKIRNNNSATRIVVFSWRDSEGQQRKAQVEVGGGQIVTPRVDMTQARYIAPVAKLQIVSCE